MSSTTRNVPSRGSSDARPTSRAPRGRGPRAKDDAPNVLIVVLDDTGFGQLGCYGSPIETPNFDALAESGLRFNNMHTTALCSPSRSCIVTGRNHHSNGMAAITELATGFPGYNGVVPFENGMLSEMLVEHGYSTFMVGKWHLTPSNQETASGPTTAGRWAAASSASTASSAATRASGIPDLVYDNHQVEPPRTPEEGYHLTEDLVDKSIEFIADAKQIDPGKPFYLHLCFGATHAPHHVPKEWADKYAGAFDDGWDAYREKIFARQKELGIVPADAELSRHDPDVPDWDVAARPDARRLFSRMMEVFAGFLSHTDHHLGRLLDFLREHGELDNTIVMVISDNGASAEGGPTGTTNEAQFFNNAQEPLEDSLSVDRRDRRPEPLQPLPVGLDLGGQHAVPALEAGDLPGRSPATRSLSRGRPGSGEGRGAHAVRAHHRHGADRPGPARHRAARRRSAASRSRRCTASASRTPSTTRGAEQAPHPVLRDAGPPRHLPRRLAGGLPVARPVVRRGRRRFGQPISAETLVEARRERVGAVPRGRGLRGEPQRRRRPPRPADRADRHVVRRGREARRAADRRQWAGPDGRREAVGRAAARSYTSGRTPSRSRSSRARGS